jgi:hypothetical protein
VKNILKLWLLRVIPGFTIVLRKHWLNCLLKEVCHFSCLIYCQLSFILSKNELRCKNS